MLPGTHNRKFIRNPTQWKGANQKSFYTSIKCNQKPFCAFKYITLMMPSPTIYFLLDLYPVPILIDFYRILITFSLGHIFHRWKAFFSLVPCTDVPILFTKNVWWFSCFKSLLIITDMRSDSTFFHLYFQVRHSVTLEQQQHPHFVQNFKRKSAQ